MKLHCTLRSFLNCFLFCVSCVASANTPTLEIEPVHTWIPTNGNKCQVVVTLTNAPGHSSVQFHLISSTWPGYCMNAGYNEFGTKPDLAFVEASQKRSDAAYFKPSGVTLAWTIPGGGDSGNAIEVSWGNTAPTQFLLYVDSYDYASVGKINARMYAGPDKRNPGQKKYVSAECMLPKSDDSAPYIASRVKQIERGWLQWNGATGEDAESGPGTNANPGDGLTAFEEYRGFKIKDTHERTSPLQKDIFVHSQFDNRVIGIGTAANLPAPFKVWLVDADEMENFKDGDNNPDKTINFLVCKDYHVLNQSALWFRPGGTTDGTLQDPTEKHFGLTFPGHLDGPVSIEWCKIYEGSIKAAVDELIRKLRAWKARTPGVNLNLGSLQFETENWCKQWTFGHELGHGIAAQHYDKVGVTRSGKSRKSVMFPYMKMQATSNPALGGTAEYFTTPEALAKGEGVWIIRHDIEYRLVPSNVSAAQKEATHSSSMPVWGNFDKTLFNTTEDGAPGAPQAPSRPGCGGSPYCDDTGRCSSTGNASQSTCGKSSCFCSGNPTRTAPTASCGTSGVSTTGRWAGMHGCNNQGTCARTGYSNVSSCARAGCACRPTPIPTTGCGGGAYCNDRGSCSSTGNASQSTCGKSSCFCSGNPTRTAPTASCGTSDVSATGRWAGMHGCNNQGTCARTGYSNVSSCARAGCACRPTPIPTTGCGGGAYCNDRGSCSSTGNASQSACRRNSCFCTGNPTRTVPTASCGTSGVSTTGRWAGMHGCNNQGTCARTGYSNVSSCARAGCACGQPTSDTNSSGNNTSTPPTPPTPPSSSGNNTSTPVTLPCGDSPTSGGNHGYVTRCPATNGRGARCTNASGYYACKPHEHTYPPPPPMHPCGTHQRTVSGNHAWVSSCTVTDPHGQTCTKTSGYYACTPHQHTYPSPPPCGVHPVGAAGNHARVSSCAVTNSQNQTCTNTTGYYACTPHQHTYPPPPPPCGVHTSGTNGSHHWIATCAVNNRHGQTCTKTSGYYACKPHEHTYPTVVRSEACNVHTSGTNGSHHWIASCAVTSRGQTCTNTSGYYACTPHTHTYPSPPPPCGVHTSGTNGSHHWIATCAVNNRHGQTCNNASGYYACTPHKHTYLTVVRYEACNVHTSGTNGSHHWIATCAITNRHGQTCNNTNGYYACTPHTHTYPQLMHRCGEHPRGSGGNHSYIRCPSRQNGYQCTGYRYACQTHTHTYPRVRPCRHLQSASGRHHWVSSCAVTNRHEQTCTNTSGYYACTPHNHTYPQRMHRCGEHPRSSGGNHSYGRCTTRQNGAQCTGYRYACRSHTHTYPTRPCKHSYSSGGNHNYIRCPSRQNGYQCTGYRYACKTHEHTYPTRPCKHSYSSGGNHNYIRCPSRWNGHQCTGYRYECRSHTHTYPRVRPCGHSYSSGGNHARVSCPRNAAGDACSSGNYYVCRSHTHRYPARRPCGHSYSSGGNHTRVTCPRNAAGDACSSGNYYVCRSHTHAYPARRPCGHLLSDSRNHTYGRCTTRQNGAQCTGSRYACKTHTHTYPRPCGHLQSASGNHNYGRCTTRQNGAQCTGSRYACKTHTHTYRRPCGHLQSASGNHNYGRCTTTQNGQRCIGSRYACKSHNHTYRRPCGHLQSASGNHNYGRCTTTQNGQRCIGSRYACKTHTHTYPTSSGNNSSGNNSSGNNSSGNDSSGNNSSGNNSSGNNSSGVRCGNTARGTSACSSGGDAPTRTSHRARCRRGHTYWGCNPNAVRWHSRH